MAVLLKVSRNSLKNGAQALFFVCVTDEHSAFREVIGYCLVRAFAGKE
jgi:hypothetical protein